jgi:ADP-heptose:LPS heptosyltransferase
VKPWNRFEQFFKHSQLRFFQHLLGVPALRPEQIDHAAIRHILIVRQHDQLGDFLLATPVFKAVRERYPQAFITVVTRSYTAHVAESNAYIDTVVPIYEHGGDWTLDRAAEVARLVRHKADLTIVLNTVSHSLTSDLIARCSTRGVILGSEHLPFSGTTRNFFYHLNAPWLAEVRHQSQRNLDILRPLGIQGGDLHEHIHLRQEEMAWAARHLAELGREAGRPLIAIHPGAGKLANRWPAARFAEAANVLAREFNAQIYATWGGSEADLGEELLAGLDQPLHSRHGEIRRMAALLAQADLFLCNDTGVMHVGAAVGTPLVAVFGPTDPGQWKPWGEAFVAVRAEDRLCISVTREQLLQPARNILRARRGEKDIN